MMMMMITTISRNLVMLKQFISLINNHSLKRGSYREKKKSGKQDI